MNGLRVPACHLLPPGPGVSVGQGQHPTLFLWVGAAVPAARLLHLLPHRSLQHWEGGNSISIAATADFLLSFKVTTTDVATACRFLHPSLNHRHGKAKDCMGLTTVKLVHACREALLSLVSLSCPLKKT